MNSHKRTLTTFCMLSAVVCSHDGTAIAGMPAPLPSSWTADSANQLYQHADSAVILRLQAISFFAVLLLLSGWFVKLLWNSVGRDFPALPQLSYGRAIGLVGLWGVAFVIVLTMISGARELMTPGAWQKQGWTYRLADSESAATVSQTTNRRRRLEELRAALWQYAATNNGQLPNLDSPAIDVELTEIPGWAGIKYLTIPNRHAEAAGRLYVFEPELDDDERLVLLTNGFIGSMNSATIRKLLSDSGSSTSLPHRGTP